MRYATKAEVKKLVKRYNKDRFPDEEEMSIGEMCEIEEIIIKRSYPIIRKLFHGKACS